MTLDRSHVQFDTTRWSLLERLRNGSDRGTAMEELASTYWPAVYGFIRRTGRGRDEASELTQEFFARVVVERGLFDRAEQGRGSLRSLIKAAVRNFLIECHRRAASRSPNGAIERASEEDRILATIPDGTDAEATFDRRWALAVLHEALRRAERHFRRTGRERNWQAFEARVLRPTTAAVEPPSLERIASDLGFRTPMDAGAAVQTVKRRIQALLREVVAESVGENADAGPEHAMIRSMLG